MLIEFTVENYRSIASRQTLSMVASNIREHEDAVIGPDRSGRLGLRLLPAVIFYGPNASGKTNVLRAFHAMCAALADSASATAGGELSSLEPNVLSTSTSTQPTFFEVRLALSGADYRYGFRASRDRVYSEWLFVRSEKPGSRERCWFARDTEEPLEWRFGPAFRGRRDLLKGRTRSTNGLALSKGAQDNYPVLSEVYEALVQGVFANTFASGPAPFVHDAARRAGSDKTHLALLTVAAREADLGIERLDVEEHVPEFEVVFRQRRSKDGSTDGPMKTLWSDDPVPRFMAKHAIGGAEKTVALEFQEESDGTRAFVAASSIIIDALRTGGLVVIDELDRSLHPLLTPLLIQLFQDPEVNKRGTQLIATTHDTSLLSAGVIRRDQVWFTQKNADAETELFSLADFTDRGARSDAALERRYLAGAFGAVPNPGNLKEAILRELESPGGLARP